VERGEGGKTEKKKKKKAPAPKRVSLANKKNVPVDFVAEGGRKLDQKGGEFPPKIRTWLVG